LRPLEEAVDAYVAERESLGYVDIGKLQKALSRLVWAVEARRSSPVVGDLSARDLESVLLSCQQEGLSASTLVYVASALRGFCRHLARRGELLVDPSRQLLVKEPPRRIGLVPSPGDVGKLLSKARREIAAVSGRRPPRDPGKRASFERRRALDRALLLRDLAMLEVLYGSGLRLGELLSVGLSDLLLSERMLRVRKGKGGKERVVPITQAAREALMEYLPARSTLGRGPTLFLSRRGGRLRSVWRVRLAALVRRAGLARALTPHRLRHACAVHLLCQGADLFAISRLLGHEDPDTTTIYLSLTEAAMERALLSAHPREKS
jgi:site-specific recombinase XerD